MLCQKKREGKNRDGDQQTLPLETCFKPVKLERFADERGSEFVLGSVRVASNRAMYLKEVAGWRRARWVENGRGQCTTGDSTFWTVKFVSKERVFFPSTWSWVLQSM